VNQIRSTKS